MLKRAEFVAAFAASLAAIAGAENITKETLKPVSRELLQALHGLDAEPLLTGDIQFINSLLAVLTPVHRMGAVEFFTHFSGFHYDDALGQYTKKSAKRYAEARAECEAFLADPLNNLFTWVVRERKMEPKVFDLSKVTKAVETAIKKAPGINKTRGDVLRAVFAAGFTVAELGQVMEEMAAEAEARDAIRQAIGGNALPAEPALM